jgi:hypothetical protein
VGAAVCPGLTACLTRRCSYIAAAPVYLLTGAGVDQKANLLTPDEGMPHSAQIRPISGTSRTECPPSALGRALTPLSVGRFNSQGVSSAGGLYCAPQ